MKKLNVKAVVIDLRHVSEETLASYEIFKYMPRWP